MSQRDHKYYKWSFQFFGNLLIKKAQILFGDFGDHRHFSRGRSKLDFGVDARVEIFEDLIFDRVRTENLDRQSLLRASTFGKVLLTAQAYEFRLGSKTFPRSVEYLGSG